MARADNIASALPARPKTPLRTWYALTVLTLIYSVHFLDRMMIALVIEPIRKEFALTDSHIGILTGLAYGVTFAAAGIPLGLLADRVNRTRLLGALVAVWSVMTALCGTAQTFGHLVLARIGVGAAEAGGSPTSLSMISDYFPPERRSTATGIFFLSTAIGAVASIFVGGVVTAQYGWRASMMLAGVPGIFLAVLLLATVREPRRGTFDAPGTAIGKAPGLGQVFKYIGANAVLLHILIGFSLNAGGVAALGAWLAAFMMRVHGMGVKDAGLSAGLVLGLFASAGSLLGGMLSDRFAARGAYRGILMAASASLLAALFAVIGLNATGSAVTLVCFSLSHLMAFAVFPSVFGTVLGLVSTRMRGTTAAALQVASNLVGYGMGPFLVGLLSDRYGGPNALRNGMLTTIVLCYAWAALHLYLSSRAARRLTASGLEEEPSFVVAH